jgi:hypothetical protein
MEHAVTVGEVVWFIVVVAGVLGVIGLFLWFLSVVASGFDH